jgi:hypothetical protein
MPPTSERSSFITVWVEDAQARLWRVETNSGAMDEIARFNIEGMTRPAVLELARLFIRGRGPQRPVLDELSNGAAPRPAKEAKKKRAPGRGSYAEREGQIARQAELRAALSRHPEGITAVALADELGRSRAGAGVPLGVLKRKGLATSNEANGLWYPVDSAPDIAVE